MIRSEESKFFNNGSEDQHEDGVKMEIDEESSANNNAINPLNGTKKSAEVFVFDDSDDDIDDATDKEMMDDKDDGKVFCRKK